MRMAPFRGRMQRLFLTCACLLFANIARAQFDRSFSPQLFHPAPGPDEFVTVETPVPLGHLGWSVGAYFNYALDPFSIFTYDPVKMTSVGGPRTHFMPNSLAADGRI